MRDEYPPDHLVFTGPIDEYFAHRHGRLPYRSLRFEHRKIDAERHQPVAVVNYPDEAVPYTRVTTFRFVVVVLGLGLNPGEDYTPLPTTMR